MRQSTRVWIKCESMGRPEDTLVLNDEVRVVILEIAKWLTSTYMGSYMRVVFARSHTELEHATAKWIRAEQSSVSQAEPDMLKDLQALMGQESLDFDAADAAEGDKPLTTSHTNDDEAEGLKGSQD